MPRRSRRANRAVATPVATAAALLAAVALGGIGAPVAAAPFAGLATQSITDPTGDSVGDAVFAQGDLVGGSATASANGVTTLTAIVAKYESPMSDSWQLALTDITWDLDLDGNGTDDADVVMIGVDDELLAGVFDNNSQLLCEATPAVDPAARSYSVAFVTECIANPAAFAWGVTMTYEDHVTEDSSIDSAPNDAGRTLEEPDTQPRTVWAGPVNNDAVAPCNAGTVLPGGPPADGFVSLVPARLLDTRPGQSTIDCQFNGTGRMGGVVEVALDVAGRGGVPLTATAAALNVTAIDADAAGFVTAYPCGTARPFTSNLNYLARTTVPNLVIAELDGAGRVCLFSNANTHLIVDVSGYFTADASFVPAGPSRAFDSRLVGPQPLPAGTILPVSGPGGSSSVFNVTVVDAATPGFATVFPCGATRPLASNVNVPASEARSNTVVAKAGAGGQSCVYLSTAANLVVDSFGSFQTSGGFETVQPARLLDTRDAPNDAGILNGPATVALQVTNRAGVPVGASAVVLNVTVDDARGTGFVTVFPCDRPQPLASNLNFVAGSTVPNAVIAKVAANGTVCLFANAPTHLVVDVNGYFPATG